MNAKFPTGGPLSRLGATLVALILLAAVATDALALDRTLRLTGRLLSTSGQPVTDGKYELRARFYDAKDAKKALYSFKALAAVTKGMFAITVGDDPKMTATEAKAFHDGKIQWVGLTVDSDPELPRLTMHQVAYALRAESAGVAKVAHEVKCTGCIGATELNGKLLATLATKKDLDGYVKPSDLKKVALTGSYNDLDDKPVPVKLGTCKVGQFVRGYKADGTPVCATDANTKYSGKNFALTNQKCPSGQVLYGHDLNGKALCRPDKDTDTKYSGKHFAVSKQTCPSGQYLYAIDASGKALCRADKDTNTTYSGKHFAKSNQGCPSGQYMFAVDAAGKALCRADKDTNSTYSGKNFALSNRYCKSGYVQRGVDSNGNPACVHHAADDFSQSQVTNLRGNKLANGTTPWTSQTSHTHRYQRRYTVILALDGDSYCPKGWTREELNTLRGGSSGYLHIVLNDSGLYMGGSNSNGYSQAYIAARIHHTHGVKHICHKTFTSSSGNPFFHMMAYDGSAGCPSGYHYIPSSHLNGNSTTTRFFATDAGVFIGRADGNSVSSHSHEESSGGMYRYASSQIDRVCFKVMGVDEDPATKDGVFPVVVGLKKTNNSCPSGFTKWYTTSLNSSGSNGYNYISMVRNAMFVGGLASWGHSGGGYQQVHYRPSQVGTTCWRIMKRTGGRPFAMIRTPQTGGCPSGYMSFNATDVKGTNNHGYVQMTADGVYIGGLDGWGRHNYDSGYIAQSLTSDMTNRLCLKLVGAQ